MNRICYFDNAATTRVDESICGIVNKYNSESFFNPSANYIQSVNVHNDVTAAREGLLGRLQAFGYKLIFLSSGTEGDNMALFGSKKRKNANIVISDAEHPAVYNAAMQLKMMGYEVRLCPVNERGIVCADDLARTVDQNTALVSIMHVNNETGGLNDIQTLVNMAKSINPAVIFHSDGVQAFGKVPVNLQALGVDLYTISGHKIGAPKGIAALLIKNGVTVSPLLYGGGQEGGSRSSTENVSGIMAFAKCAERAVNELADNAEKYRNFRAVLMEGLKNIDGVKILSSSDDSPHIFTVAFSDVRGEVLQHSLEAEGFLVGTGSACSARRAHDRIPKALGLGNYADGIIRVSFGRENSLDEVKALACKITEHHEILKKYVGK